MNPSVTHPDLPELRGHIPALDGLRGVAILWVMLHHFFEASGAEAPLLASVPLLGALMAKILFFGHVGVDLFFVLSGFLITGILLDSRNAPHRFRNFYARRVLRIFPVYLLALTLIFIVLPLVVPSSRPDTQGVARYAPWYWLHSSSLLQFVGNVPLANSWYSVGHFWSLSVEEHFYLFWPLLVYCLPVRRLPAVAWIFVFLPLALRFLFMRTLHGALTGFTFCRTEGLAGGALIAIYTRDPQTWRRLLATCRAMLVPALITAAGLAFAPRAIRAGLFMRCIEPSIMAILFVPVLVFTLRGGWLQTAMQTNALRFFGKYSYGLYVFHYLFQPHLTRWFGVDMIAKVVQWKIAQWILALTLPICVSIAIALLSWHLYEKQFLKLKRYFAPAIRRPQPQRPVVLAEPAGALVG